MTISRQFRDAIGQGGHGRQIGARQVGIRHAHADVAFAKEQQLDQGEGINACLG